MYLHILIGQRREDYPGQYGLEDLGSMTEYDVDVNPAYLRDREVEIRSSGEFDRLAWVRAEVDEDAVDAELADAAVASREFAALGFVDLSLELAAVRAILYPEDRPLPATLLTGGTA